MPRLLFVHGTGVREPGFSRTLRVIRARVTATHPDWSVAGCYWGKEHGVAITVPKTAPAGRHDDTGRTRSVAEDSVDDAELAMTVWQILYDDPRFELRWIAAAGRGDRDETPLAPGAVSLGRGLRRKLDTLAPSPELAALLDANDLRDPWTLAQAKIVNAPETGDALDTDHPDLPGALARALVAATIVAAADEGSPSPTAETRDAVVTAVLAQLGGETRSITGWILAPLKGIAARRITTYVADHRSGVSAEAAPVAGDVLLYQTRGDQIRQFITNTIAAIAEPVYIVAHSLGGIACVDTLITGGLTNVRGVITVGSQAPLLYELDCLTNLRPPQPLPAHFPPWLNVFDPRDFLSYLAEPVFDPKVARDVEVRSGQPFPQSHSAYWENDAVWRNVFDFIGRIELASRNGEP